MGGRFDVSEQALARAWGRLLLELLLDERGRRALKESGPRALADLPLFEHVDGSTWTLNAILRLFGGGEAVYLWQMDGDAVESPPKLTFLEAPNVRSVLAPLVGPLEDVQEMLRRQQARSSNRAVSPDMPKPPADAVEIGHVLGRGAEGLIWIDTHLDEGAVALGDAEKIAGFVDPSSVFVVGGALHGTAVTIDDAWEFATLSRRAGQLLRKRAHELYAVVHERFDPLAAERDRNWHRDRAVLRALVLRMHEQWQGGQKASNGPARRFYKALYKVPLFELPNGRAVTLDQFAKFTKPKPESEPEPEPVVEASPPEPVVETPEPESEAKPEPKPDAPPPPSPHAMLLDAIRTELRIVRKGTVGALSNAMLDLIRFGRVPTADALAEFIDGSVHIDVDHPVVDAALEAEEALRARLVSMLASSVFTAYNLGLEEVTDQHEVDFHRSHAEHLGT